METVAEQPAEPQSKFSPEPVVSRRQFLTASAASVALGMLGGCASRSKTPKELEIDSNIATLNNLIADSGWECIQKEGYEEVCFVYDQGGTYVRTIFANANGPFIVFTNKEKDSRFADGTTHLSPWESASTEQFDTIEEVAAYLHKLSTAANAQL